MGRRRVRKRPRDEPAGVSLRAMRELLLPASIPRPRSGDSPIPHSRVVQHIRVPSRSFADASLHAPQRTEAPTRSRAAIFPASRRRCTERTDTLGTAVAAGGSPSQPRSRWDQARLVHEAAGSSSESPLRGRGLGVGADDASCAIAAEWETTSATATIQRLVRSVPGPSLSDRLRSYRTPGKTTRKPRKLLRSFGGSPFRNAERQKPE